MCCPAPGGGVKCTDLASDNENCGQILHFNAVPVLTHTQLTLSDRRLRADVRRLPAVR